MELLFTQYKSEIFFKRFKFFQTIFRLIFDEREGLLQLLKHCQSKTAIFSDIKIGKSSVETIPCFNPFIPNALFLYPLKTLENRKVFWCFQEVEKVCIENKCVNVIFSQIQYFILASGEGYHLERKLFPYKQNTTLEGRIVSIKFFKRSMLLLKKRHCDIKFHCLSTIQWKIRGMGQYVSPSLVLIPCKGHKK